MRFARLEIWKKERETARPAFFSHVSPVRVRERVQLVFKGRERGPQRLGPGFRDVRADRAEAVLRMRMEWNGWVEVEVVRERWCTRDTHTHSSWYALPSSRRSASVLGLADGRGLLDGDAWGHRVEGFCASLPPRPSLTRAAASRWRPWMPGRRRMTCVCARVERARVRVARRARLQLG